MTDTEIPQEDLAAGVVPVVQELFASITNWVVVQKTAEGDVHWIIETKGRVWEGTEAKDAAIRDWCQRITEQTGQRWEFARVNQASFRRVIPRRWPRRSGLFSQLASLRDIQVYRAYLQPIWLLRASTDGVG